MFKQCHIHFISVQVSVNLYVQHRGSIKEVMSRFRLLEECSTLAGSYTFKSDYDAAILIAINGTENLKNMYLGNGTVVAYMRNPDYSISYRIVTDIKSGDVFSYDAYGYIFIP